MAVIMFYSFVLLRVAVPHKATARMMSLVIGLLAIGLLAGCDTLRGKEEKLPGKRLPVLTEAKPITPDPALIQVTVRLPKPYVNNHWPQTGGYPTHSLYHLALSGPVRKLWNRRAGSGISRIDPILISPIIAGGTVYWLDGKRNLISLDLRTGQVLWRVALLQDDAEETTPGSLTALMRLFRVGDQEADQILLGGIAYDSDILVVTVGHAGVAAYSAIDGSVIWARALPGPVRSAPTIVGGRVLVVGADSRVYALRLDDGKEIWRHTGTPSSSSRLGDASAAATRDQAIVANASGEVAALRIDTGERLWEAVLPDQANNSDFALPSDITAPPVIDRDQVIILGQGRGLVSLGLDSGRSTWSSRVQGTQMPWIGGDWLYILTSDAELLAFARKDGAIRWKTEMPRYSDSEKRTGQIRYFGPILAGHRLILTSSAGDILAFSPYNGQFLGRISVGDSISTAPILATETLIILTDGGTIQAYR